MFVLDGRVVTSASDLSNASACEFGFVRKLGAKLGRYATVPDAADAMLKRAGMLGTKHEAAVLERYRAELGDGVVEIASPDRFSAEGLAQAAEETRAAFAGGAEVVFQATFFDGEFLGYADFIVRQSDGSYLVQDTKLARRAKVTALLQLAAYVEQLELAGIPCAPTVELLLGDGSVSSHRVDDIMPVYRKRRQRLLDVVAEQQPELGADGPIAEWGDARYAVCGQCEYCEPAIEAAHDVLQVAGMRVQQRDRLMAAGTRTIEDLAALDGGGPLPEVERMLSSTLAGLAAQAALQLQAAQNLAAVAGPTAPPVDLFKPSVLGVIPAPDAGDVFFDFEGDPLYTEGDGTVWGLDYLFGLVEADGTFRAWWAHNFAEERTALIDFLAYIGERRRAHPHMHIYHYASYERTHLLSLAGRHGVGEDAVDQLLREHALVDLYPLVRGSMRVGSHSYSIKKLEPLYMPSSRQGEVTNAADSITEYAEARALHDAGDEAGCERMLGAIASYNKYDCDSTLALRDWLLAQAASRGVYPGSVDPDADKRPDIEASPLGELLLARAGDPALSAERMADETAAAMAAAALDYHRREQKSFWWGHFARLVDPIEEWEEARDVLRVDGGAGVVRDWYREGKQRTDRRQLRLSGTWAPGSSPKPGDQAGPFAVYAHPGPFTLPSAEPGSRPTRAIRVLEVDDDGTVLVEETLAKDIASYSELPIALTPSSPPPAGQQKPAIESWAQAIVDAGERDVSALDAGSDSWPRDPVVDILRRTPPRLRGGGALVSVANDDYIEAVVASLRVLDDSYLAVQGPPGTGKTYLASHVITRLVRDHGWKIGVVAQSHAVVTNVLGAVVSAGLEPSLVGKVPKTGETDAHASWSVLPKDGQLQFALEHRSTGFVVGGTAWDFANPARVPRRSLDLLVVDEAGQFSLASTVAASVSAHNLLLLGDPQQLPQVSQGTHPEPVDTSALGWVANGHDVLPASLGYFLAASRRMHPEVAAPVSRLSYEGALHSHESAGERMLAGIEPGLHPVPVEHVGNSTESVEEALAVAKLVQSLLGTLWRESADAASAPLAERDFIVVTPYNAQLNCVSDALAAAGLSEVRVGTVDKFQGQEAVIAIVSLAASSAAAVPRGMEFLIMKNRLNVAISRAQWAAYLVYSPALTDYLPPTPQGVAELSAFIRLVETR